MPSRPIVASLWVIALGACGGRSASEIDDRDGIDAAIGGIEDAVVIVDAYHVSLDGNDAVSCEDAKNAATPKRTIGDALTCVTAGETLLVRGGRYDEVLRNNVPSGTSWS